MKTNSKIGLRIIKSAVAVFLCYIVNYFRGESGFVFYSALSALWCVQSYVSTTKHNAHQRIMATFLGACFGLIILLFFTFLRNEFSINKFSLYFLKAVVTSLSVILVIHFTVLIKQKHAAYYSCVVFLSIVINHFSDANPFIFALNRFIDTSLGILIGVGVNLFHLPRKKHKDILFISGLDDTLLDEQQHLNDYCKIELNRMIDEGLNFTLFSMRPPASIIEPMKDIQLKIPIIAMDGAVLFDTREKRFLEIINMEKSDSVKVKHFLEEQNLIYFANVVIDDTLLIFNNHSSENCFDEQQAGLVKKLRISPYRNFINREVPESEKVVYFMMFYPDAKAKEIYKTLVDNGFTDHLKVVFYSSKDYEGYSYIKIFNQYASKENMVELLKRRLGIDETITFGTIPSKYDYVVAEGDTNEVVHKMKKLFEGRSVK